MPRSASKPDKTVTVEFERLCANAILDQKEHRVSDKPKKKPGVRIFLTIYVILLLIVFAISYFVGGNFQ
ncbi:hypothetical protein Pan153_34170 [Gimesia panareensis]|uniref:Uncharacterized protein n=1 Tax=Gimesia panareensis TaxID=2527978 RepID=A0A518FQX9_9PLAN|nr:hypothetical protein Pan153_34170 [Gimesia panareensis]